MMWCGRLANVRQREWQGVVVWERLRTTATTNFQHTHYSLSTHQLSDHSMITLYCLYGVLYTVDA